MDNETASEYVSAKELSVKCNEAGLNVSERQLVYNVVKGWHQRFSQIRKILKTQREKKLDEVSEIVREKERELQKRHSSDTNNDSQEKAYVARDRQKKNPNCKKKCFICGKLGHIAKDCYHRKDRQVQISYENRGKHTNDRNKGNYSKKANYTSNKRKTSIFKHREIIHVRN